MRIRGKAFVRGTIEVYQTLFLTHGSNPTCKQEREWPIFVLSSEFKDVSDTDVRGYAYSLLYY